MRDTANRDTANRHGKREAARRGLSLLLASLGWYVMRHATEQDLATLNPFLEQLRGLPGVVERKPGIFYVKSCTFLRFHLN